MFSTVHIASTHRRRFEGVLQILRFNTPMFAGAAALFRVSSPAAPSAPPATRTAASARMPIRLMAGSVRRR